MQLIVAYLVAAVVFGGLDAMWLSWAGPNLYRPLIGEILAPSFRPVPAVIFYVFYLAGMIWFAVRPGLTGGVGTAALNGALLGALAYATYDMTNQATMKVWSTQMTVIDIAWGAFATAVAASVATWAALKVGG